MKTFTIFKQSGLFVLLLGLVLGLAACGDSATNTPAAVATTAATTSGTATTAAAGQTSVAPGANPPGGGNGRGGAGAVPISGTVASYDATTKMVTVKTSDGQSQQFDASNARISKNAKVSSDDFSKALTADSLVQVAGEQGSDGTYTATSLTVLSANFRRPGNGGTPGANAGTNRNGGTPGANAGTPGANGGPGGRLNGGPGRGVTVQGGKLTGDTLTGTTPFNNGSVTVKLTGSTNLYEQQVGKLDDLQSGLNVVVNAAPAQNGGTSQAFSIVIQ